jgi:hypothetical protein
MLDGGRAGAGGGLLTCGLKRGGQCGVDDRCRGPGMVSHTSRMTNETLTYLYY